MIEMKHPRQFNYRDFDRRWIYAKAQRALKEPCVHITDTEAPLSEGGIHDFYSNADYWWPNPNTEDGLPYIKRDGESNPNNFFNHRIAMRKMRSDTAALAAAYVISGEEKYAYKAIRNLREFFVDAETCMNPSLDYAQAVPGLYNGRGIGIIDTIHLIDIPFAMEALKKSVYMNSVVYDGVKNWFSKYLYWLKTSENGKTEMAEPNNHSVCNFVQLAAYALFCDDNETIELCRHEFKTRFLPCQVEKDGSFPWELKRTKPYSYSIMVADALATLCYLISDTGNNLWEYENDGRSMKKVVDFIAPYMADKSKWFKLPDVEHYESLPVAMPFLLFAGEAYGERKYINLYEKLPRESFDIEIRRNIAIRQPILWLIS